MGTPEKSCMNITVCFAVPGKWHQNYALPWPSAEKKSPIAVMLENYCRINVTTENVPQLHLCWLQEERKLQAIVLKVNNFREKWMGKDNINRQQLFRVKRTLPGADVEQRRENEEKQQEDTCHQNSKRVEFFPNFAFRKGRLKLILQLLKKSLF